MLRILSFEEKYWDDLQEFINREWKENHPITDKKLFFWQYSGPEAEIQSSKIAIMDGRIVGFLGMIPAKYKLDRKILKGAALAVWLVRRDLRNSGIGILLLKEAEKESECLVCLGVNQNVVGIYKKLGYQYLERLNRYCIVIDPLAKKLFKEPTAEIRASSISSGERSSSSSLLTGDDIPAELAERLWQKFLLKYGFKFSLYRDKRFWQWRYQEAVGFKYVSFTDDKNLIIGRFEKISSLADKAVFRIIELLITEEEKFPVFIDNILRYLREREVILIDFQISSDRLEPLLRKVGFFKAEGRIAEIFNPLNFKIQPINIVMKLPQPTDFRYTYLVKSDGDMDRVPLFPTANTK